MNFAYLRISTDKQDADSQLIGIRAYACSHRLEPFTIERDTASGARSWRERSLFTLLEKTQPGDVLLVAEVSRLGRSTLDVLDCLKEAAARQVSVHIVKQNMLIDGSMHSKIVVTMLALAGEIEREFIRARTKEGLQRAKEAGTRLGRPPGEAEKLKLTTREAELNKLRAAGVSDSAIARLTGTSRHTVARFFKRQQAKPQEQEKCN
jgi:DNA invertase Pin-like site-specific DNA recombinase